MDIEKTDVQIASFEMATFGSRFFALMIDMIISLCISAIIYYALMMIMGIDFETISKMTWPNFVSWPIFIFIFLRPTALKGKTPGKTIMDIKVVNKDTHEPIGYVSALIRNFGMAISSFFFIGYLMALRKSKKALHDHIAGTLVIKDQ